MANAPGHSDPKILTVLPVLPGGLFFGAPSDGHDVNLPKNAGWIWKIGEIEFLDGID